MSRYTEIKKTTWRGAKVRKILKFLKSYQYIVGHPQFSIRDISDELIDEKRKMEITFYGTNLAIEVVQTYIEKVFERDQYTKKDFNKKIFSGAKVVSVLEYIDFTIENAKKNINILQNEPKSFLSLSENRDTFMEFWNSQLDTYLKVKKWILFGLNPEKREIDEGDDDWIESIIYDLNDEDDDS